MRPVPRRLAIVVLTASVAGCGGGRATNARPEVTDRGPPGSATTTLQRAPAAVANACRSLARSRTVRVLCPTRLPTGRWVVHHRTLRNGRCAYLLDVGTRPFGQDIPFHALAGGRCRPWPLTTRNGHWPADQSVYSNLGLVGTKPLRPGQPGTTPPTPVPPRVLRRIQVGGHAGLLLRAVSYPDGGVHGGHIAAIWNQNEHGYVLSLHFTEGPRAPTAASQQTVIDTAATMSRSAGERIAAAPGGTPSPTAGTVVLSNPARELRRRGAALQLTRLLPRSVRRACATAAAKTGATVYCPPLVPTGRALVDGVDGLLRSRDFRSGFEANFESHSVQPSPSAPGHWTMAEGTPAALRVGLHPPNYDPREGSIVRRRLQIEHTPATLWLLPSFRIFHSIYGGHVVITWRCAGRGYQVSMHGHNNTTRAVLIATALVDELPSSCRR